MTFKCQNTFSVPVCGLISSTKAGDFSHLLSFLSCCQSAIVRFTLFFTLAFPSRSTDHLCVHVFSSNISKQKKKVWNVVAVLGVGITHVNVCFGWSFCGCVIMLVSGSFPLVIPALTCRDSHSEGTEIEVWRGGRLWALGQGLIQSFLWSQCRTIRKPVSATKF